MNEIHIDMQGICKVIITFHVYMVSLFGKLYHHFLVRPAIASTVLFDVGRFEGDNRNIQCLTHFKQDPTKLTQLSEIYKIGRASCRERV